MFTLTPPAPVVNFDSAEGYADALPAALAVAPTEVEPIGPTEADDAWWAAETRQDAEPTDADWDDMADNAAAVDALALGYCHA